MIALAPLANLPALESNRLLLRRLCMRDAPDIFDYSRDPEVARHVLWSAHASVSESRSYIRYMLRRYRLGEPSSWGIVLKAKIASWAPSALCGFRKKTPPQRSGIPSAAPTGTRAS